jgi:hypothetical protein
MAAFYGGAGQGIALINGVIKKRSANPDLFSCISGCFHHIDISLRCVKKEPQSFSRLGLFNSIEVYYSTISLLRTRFPSI